ncbi:hypothetical protein FGSG_05881 [Fusarium graminearum PH-1]|uniref:Chromosome 3, complete genome n=1 Tax=Gibberella zeae (strain ATCC MYA-4620 / CBS 123657 / FGSC 9075 / NRRL 31084 / PH-1) TaxID=229533 RepID=I1RPB9_GIBZE|nr:hypothetical protein FGSG_05881 [Fusarium graminearum PH-1]ESU11910.1 hypothetical protein FGSG_05881 [Fusarium graminearum PH-1]CEF86436.1 unnamed protein product [Fusarium graminearum]|eukprot:XP_011324486.1 hypothetical protein FGSG_05881 [Fusarium graminearum PH-1]
MNRTTQGRRLVMMSEAVLPEERLQPGLFRPTRISTWPRTPELKELPRPRTAKSRYTTLLPPGKNLHTDTGDTYTSPSKTLHTGIPAGQSLSPGCTAFHRPFAVSTHMSRHGGRIRHGQYG